MRLWAVILLVLLSGCSPWSKPQVIVVPPEEQKAAGKLIETYQQEVAKDAAILKAVRPHLTASKAPALHLYDTVTQSLVSLGGEPTAADVEKFSSLILNPNQKELEDLRAKAVALDAKTNKLEAEVAKEREARLKAEAAADIAKEAQINAAKQANRSDSIKTIVTKAGWGLVAGILALLFGSKIGLNPINAWAAIGASAAVMALAAPAVDFFGDERCQRVALALFAGLAIEVAFLLGLFGWRKVQSWRAAKA